jgi:hypothetical protein
MNQCVDQFYELWKSGYYYPFVHGGVFVKKAAGHSEIKTIWSCHSTQHNVIMLHSCKSDDTITVITVY